MKTTIDKFLKPKEIAKATELVKNNDAYKATLAIRDEIIQPNLARINEALGQENDAMYLAYAVTWVIVSTTERYGKQHVDGHYA